MPAKLRFTILGLDTLGASFGLAAQGDPLLRIGYDADTQRVQAARKAKAVDKTAYNLENAVKGADLVLVNLPLHEIRAALKAIAPRLKADAIVLDTAPAKAQVAAWARELLPAGVHHVGLLPVVNPAYLPAASADAPRADWFRGAVMGIVAEPDTAGKALQAAADLAVRVGAQPLFLEMAEADGLLAAVEMLPRLLAAALVQVTTAEPGWPEARKFASQAYAAATAAATPGAEAPAAIAHRAALGRLLLRLMAQLNTLADWLAAGDEEALDDWLAAAVRARRDWLDERRRHDWDALPRPPTPTTGEVLKALFGRRDSPKAKSR